MWVSLWGFHPPSPTWAHLLSFSSSQHMDLQVHMVQAIVDMYSRQKVAYDHKYGPSHSIYLHAVRPRSVACWWAFLTSRVNLPGPWPMPSMALVDVVYIFLVPRLSRSGRVDAGDSGVRDMTPTTPPVTVEYQKQKQPVWLAACVMQWSNMVQPCRLAPNQFVKERLIVRLPRLFIGQRFWQDQWASDTGAGFAFHSTIKMDQCTMSNFQGFERVHQVDDWKVAPSCPAGIDIHRCCWSLQTVLQGARVWSSACWSACSQFLHSSFKVWCLSLVTRWSPHRWFLAVAIPSV